MNRLRFLFRNIVFDLKTLNENNVLIQLWTYTLWKALMPYSYYNYLIIVVITFTT